ncbi:MAG TPA: hypothetical protein VNJ12_08075 [Candidatus Dormibacteraeota bacterium]|nr:hypothetical protein [Candidatus Dormibacteraeota bacterium]
MDIRKWKNRLAWTGTLVSLGVLLFTAACSQTPGGPTDPPAAGSASATRAQYESTARRALGDGSEVILSGDLAHDGHIQLLIVNRLPQTQGKAPGSLLVSRAAVLEKENENWHEIFLADDHLKNEEGFLPAGSPGSVSAWRLQYDRGKQGLAMFFTPMRQASGPDPATIEVRWNPGTGRYQSFDRQSGSFLMEAANPGGVPSFLLKR